MSMSLFSLRINLHVVSFVDSGTPNRLNTYVSGVHM